MKTIINKDYVVFYDESGNPIGGENVDSNSSIVTNLEDVTSEKIVGYTIDEL